jgi:hypothetical protein
MSIDPMRGGAGNVDGEPDQGSADGAGSCSVCGRPLPAPDLEAVAASIDHTLSMEAGRMVPRTAWAGRPPDGVIDGLLFWLPSVKASRQIWERGQALWTEQMTAVLAGPCDECRREDGAASERSSPPYTQDSYTQDPYAQHPSTDPAPIAATTYLPAEAAVPAAPGTPGQPRDEYRAPTYSGAGDAMTAAIPAYSDYSPASEPAADFQTAAMPAYTNPTEIVPSAPAQIEPPAGDGDEHESHTVILSSMPSLRTSTRLVVLDGPVRGRQFSLGRERTTIGRSIGCHITVEADAVEYDHATIVRDDDRWRVEKAGTGGELTVNDEPVTDPRLLNSGDVIRIGPARLRFETVNRV